MKPTMLVPFMAYTAVSMGNVFDAECATTARRQVEKKRFIKCGLPGCEILHDHNGGYCCAGHYQKHKDVIKKEKYDKRLQRQSERRGSADTTAGRA